ncbi:hypothetical protein RB195_024177 [Necator americanus]|uniref:Transposase n=1 Tax=Necator americanus TaxID=51031 RepID=A0ABR1EM94_NECAM
MSFDELKDLSEQHSYESVRYFAVSLGCSLSTVSNGLRSLGMVKKFEASDSTGWTPLSLEMKNGSSTSTTPTNVSGALAMKCRIHFVKGEIHEKKVMLSVWWRVHGIYRFELLPDNMTVTAEVYCAQLQTLADKIRKEHPKLDNVHDNARPHIAKKTSQKILELGWEVLPHTPCSPELVPSDYHLFRSFQHHLEEKRSDDRDHLENDLRAFFASPESPEFYAKGIRDLARRWQREDDSGDENHLYATKILETIILESGNHAAEVIPTIILTALRRLMKPSEEGLSELRPLLFLVIVAAMYTCTEVSLTYIRQVAEPNQNPLDYICEELVDLNKKFEGIHNRRLALFGICVLFLLPSSTRPAMINTNPKKVLEASLSMFDSLQRALKTQAQARKEDDSRSDESEADSDEEGGAVVKLKKGLRHRKVRSEHLSDDEDEIDEMSLDYIDAVTKCKNPNGSDGNGDTDAGSDSAIESSFFEVEPQNLQKRQKKATE